jgi:hypothetical protein
MAAIQFSQVLHQLAAVKVLVQLATMQQPADLAAAVQVKVDLQQARQAQ